MKGKRRGNAVRPILMFSRGKLARASMSDIVEAVLMLVSLVPPGRVTTYGSIARVLGVSPRLVGRALALNKNPIIVPCHRVVRSDLSLGGYSGPGGVRFKEMLLRLEGVRIVNGRVIRDHVIDVSELLDA